MPVAGWLFFTTIAKSNGTSQTVDEFSCLGGFLLLFDILCGCGVVTSIDRQHEQPSITYAGQQDVDEIALDWTTENPDESAPASNNFDTYNDKSQQETNAAYVLNTSTKKFHYPSCRDVPKIAPQNYSTSDLPRDSLISRGYSSCGHCKP